MAKKKGKLRPGKEVKPTKDMGLDDREVHLELFKQLKLQFYKEGGERSTLETLKDNLGGAVLAEVSLIYQRMNKKNDSTKIKSLGTLMELLETKDDVFLTQLMPSWTVIHEKLVLSEVHPEIHYGAAQVNRLIITKARKAIKKNFRAFFPSMLLSTMDNYEKNRAIATENLDLVLKDDDKKAMAVLMCQDSIITFVKSFLTEPSTQF